MKILFPLLYIAEHSGDNAIWTKLIRTIESAYPNSEYICPVQYSPEQTEILKWDTEQLKKVSKNIRIVPQGLIENFNEAEFNKLRTRDEVISYLDKVIAKDVLKEADMLISMGGGYMFCNTTYILYLVPFYVAQKMGKPTFFNTQTFSGNDFTQATKILTNIVLNNAKYISPREQASFDNLRNTFGITSELTMVQDFTFDIKPDDSVHEFDDSVIKFNIRQDIITEHSIKVIAEVADLLIDKLGVKIAFVPICHGGERDDRIAHKKIVSLMKHECLLIDKKLTVAEAKTLLKNGITITDRFHTAVFSASVFTPFVLMEPDIGYKAKGLLDAIDYPIKEVLSLGQVDSGTLYDYIMSIYNKKKEIKEKLEVTIPKVIKDVTNATFKLLEKLKNG